MFEPPKRYVVYQNDVTMGLDLFDTWYYDPNSYFGKGKEVFGIVNGNANLPRDVEFAKFQAEMLNETNTSYAVYLCVRVTSFLKYCGDLVSYWWDIKMKVEKNDN